MLQIVTRSLWNLRGSRLGHVRRSRLRWVKHIQFGGDPQFGNALATWRSWWTLPMWEWSRPLKLLPLLPAPKTTFQSIRQARQALMVPCCTTLPWRDWVDDRTIHTNRTIRNVASVADRHHFKCVCTERCGLIRLLKPKMSHSVFDIQNRNETVWLNKRIVVVSQW